MAHYGAYGFLNGSKYDMSDKAMFEQGKKAEYDAFWDIYQYAINGVSQRTTCAYMFAFGGWNDDTFKPKYSMPYMNNAGNMFNTCAVTDLSTALERQGVVFDFSKCAQFASTFSYTKLTRVPTISTLGTTPASPFNSMFYGSTQLHTIDKLILKSDGSQTFNNTFYNCTALENIVIEGVIGKNGFDLQYSPKLSKASIESVINALSSTTSGLSITLSAQAVRVAFQNYNADGEGLGDGDASNAWEALKATKPNWTISLVY